MKNKSKILCITLLLFFSNIVTQAQEVTTFAGKYQGDFDGQGTAAQFNYPTGIAIDTNGNLFVVDANNTKIRKITPEGFVSTFAGSSMGSADGTGTTAQFDSPYGITIDAANNLFITDSYSSRIRKITPDGVVSTIAGSIPGFADGTGSEAQFNNPAGIAIDVTGNLYVADKNNNRIRKVTPLGAVSTIAGNASSGLVDGIGTDAKFSVPFGITIDATGNLYVADTFNNTIRKITTTGEVTTLAGSNIIGTLDGIGTAAQFFQPCGITIDALGNLYVADSWSSKIRKITPAGMVTTVAGETLFNYPQGIAIDTAGNLFIADTNNFRIQKIGLFLNKNNFKLVSSFSFYPNPSNEILYVNSNYDGDFIILNQVGQITKSFKVKSNSFNTINISDLSAGIYYVKSVKETNISSQKLIIQ